MSTSSSVSELVNGARERLRAALSPGAFLLSLLFRHAPLAALPMWLINVADGAAMPLIVWAMGGLINAVLRLPATHSDPWKTTFPWLVALLTAFLLRRVGSVTEPYLSRVVRERVDAAVQHDLYVKAIALPLAEFEQQRYYSQLDTGRQAIGDGLLNWLGELNWLTGLLAGLAGILILFARASLPLGALLLATALAQVILSARMSSEYGSADLQHSPLRRERGYWAGLLASRAAAPELRLFGLAAHLLARWRTVGERLLAELVALRRRIGAKTLRQALPRELIGLAALLYLLLLALQGTIGIGSLAALLYGLAHFRDMLSDATRLIYRLDQLSSQLAHLRDFLALDVEWPVAALPEGTARRPLKAGDGTVPMGGRTPASGDPRLGPLRDGVVFHDVSFTYPGATGPALAEINLRLRPRERVALVGENGAGKTTLVRLVLGLYQPTAGRITVDGVDLARIDPRQWRREATAVFQDFVRYPTSVLENIGIGDVALLMDGNILAAPVPPRIVAAAEQATADSFIAALPTGYATLLGKEFDGAVDLSSGQWQRLALARAYLRDAQIVVLDEPTAALDPRAEVEVYRQFAHAAAGRCAVLISHRLGSARLADRIVVLRGGRIVEEGGHDELLRRDGEYARMYRLQAAWYGEG